MLLVLVLSMVNVNAYASIEELGVFGGISAGKNLPKTIEKYVKKSKSKATSYPYKEVVFISGKPVELEGEIIIKRDTSKVLKTESGNYKESIEVKLENKDGDKIKRKISYSVDYQVINNDFSRQIRADAREDSIKWSETLTVEGKSFKLNPKKSTYSMTEVSHLTPGVTYFDRTISTVAYYDVDEGEVIVSRNGSQYGYEQSWSKNETGEFTIEVSGLGEDLDIVAKTKSNVNAKKEIYFDKTNPYAISFAGTYNQRLVRDVKLTYDVISGKVDKPSGSMTIKTGTSIEKLPIPAGLDFIRGHWAEDDMKKLYSMDIYTESPHAGMQYEAITRGDYVKALVKALDIDINMDRKERDRLLFGDVLPDNALYPYIMGAYRANLVKGAGSSFEVDRPITREEAFVIMIRVIGLERLGGLEGVSSPFIDDAEISHWARRDIEAGRKLGLIRGDRGKVHPKAYFTKAEAAAIVNRLIDFLRDDIAKTY